MRWRRELKLRKKQLFKLGMTPRDIISLVLDKSLMRVCARAGYQSAERDIFPRNIARFTVGGARSLFDSAGNVSITYQLNITFQWHNLPTFLVHLKLIRDCHC